MTSTTSTAMPTIAFIGLGIMGSSMALNLMKAGFPLHVSTRSPAKAAPLVEAGAILHATAGEAAAEADVVITIVGLPSDVEEVYFCEGGILNRAKKGALLIDMTTSSPSLAIRIAEEAAKRGLSALDAPVSGGDIGAREARLSIMVGGDEEAFERAQPVFKAMGTTIAHQGGAGAGQHTKACNQIVIANNMMGVAESIAYARAAGLDVKKVLSSIGTGAAGSFLLNALGPKMLDGDFAPGFMIEHFVKDMTIAAAEAAGYGLDLVGLQASMEQYKRRLEAGDARDGTQAIIKSYEE
jgi:3-hydroxyisobutyrate dehydrogenase and related beta-hydroxyacid dehydrogenases